MFGLPCGRAQIQRFLAAFQVLPAEKKQAPQYAAVEFVYLLSGSLDIKVGNEDFTLQAGDAIHFDSSVQHSLPARRPTAL
jgi:mannose-6-phosphate isomerase-like protein (cupin superfamily)